MSILVTRSSMPSFDEYTEEIRDLWDSHWLTNMGPKHKKLQAALKEYMGVENIELLTNGHMSLELTLQALDLKGEVITTPYTFASTTHAIVRNGLEPVFCDIEPDTYTIDADQIEDLITDRTSAILPVHVYGNMCDTDQIDRIAKKHGLKVIYDAAHAFGETYKGLGAGAFGDASCFSFHATKVFNTIEGGAVCFKDQAIGARLYDLKNFGIHGPDHVTGIGANAKMNEFCAAMGLCNLRHVDEAIEGRRRVAERYEEHLSGVKGLRIRTIQSDVKSNYAYFPIFIEPRVFGRSRDEVKAELEREDIITRKYFYPLTNSFEAYQGRFDPALTPVAQHCSDTVLALPMYTDLSPDDVDRICSIILQR